MEVERAANALFPSQGQAVTNIKFFLGSKRSITAEELAEQVNRAEAQVRNKLAVPSQKLDGDLPKTQIL
jgi:predicted transcriptional regulator